MGITSLTQHDLAIEGHTVHVVEAGPKHAQRCFVLVHGIGVSWRYFEPLVRELQKQHRVVCVDLPGFGDSSRPKEVLTIGDFARVVHGVIDELRIDKPVLVGNSMGCQIVMEMDHQKPSAANKLVLIGPMVRPKKRNLLGHFGRLLRDAFSEPLQLNLLALSDYMRSAWPYIKTLRPMLSHPIEERFRACRTEVTVIRGAKDPITTHEWAVAAIRMLSRGNLVEISDAGHVAHFTHPKEVASQCMVQTPRNR